jgi:hypothetical protein
LVLNYFEKEVIEVNRKILLTVLALAAVMLATSVNMALAATTYYDYMDAGGRCVVDVPGQPRVLIYMWTMHGTFYSGRADRIMLIVETGLPVPAFYPVAGYEDVPTRSAFSASLGLPTVEHVVKKWQIGIYRIGKTSIAYWTVPLECPATALTPQVTIPPGVLVLKGHDGLIPVSGPATTVPNGWSYSVEGSVHNAHATFFCPGWHFFGSVGEAFVGTDLDTKSIVSETWTWTSP